MTHFSVHFADKARDHARDDFQREILAIVRRNDLALASRFGRPAPTDQPGHLETCEKLDSLVEHLRRSRPEDRVRWLHQIGATCLMVGAGLMEVEALDATSGSDAA